MYVNKVNSDNISFKGSIYSNKMMLNTLKYAADKAPIVASGATLFLSTFVRPVAIMLTPKADKKEKQYNAAKSMSSGLISFALTTLAFNPVAKAVDTISQNPKQYLKKATINNLHITQNASKPFNFLKQAVKYTPPVLTVIPKALLTTALITPIIETIFDNRNKKDTQKIQNKPKTQSKNISFQGIQEQLIKRISKFIDNPKSQELAIKYQNVTNTFHHSMTLKDVCATGCFAVATKFSKRIDEEMKEPLIINSFISTILTVTGGYAINKITEKPTDKFIEKLKKANQHDSNIEKYIDGVRVLKPIIILGAIYYAVIPALATCFTNKITTKRKNCNAKV